MHAYVELLAGFTGASANVAVDSGRGPGVRLACDLPCSPWPLALLDANAACVGRTGETILVVIGCAVAGSQTESFQMRANIEPSSIHVGNLGLLCVMSWISLLPARDLGGTWGWAPVKVSIPGRSPNGPPAQATTTPQLADARAACLASSRQANARQHALHPPSAPF